MKLFQQFRGKSMALRALLFSTQAPFCVTVPLKCAIMGAGDPKTSVVPILEQWIRQGNEIPYSQLQNIIRDLRSTKRFNHALQMLQWMGDKGGYDLSAADCGVQLELASRVHGIELAEDCGVQLELTSRVDGIEQVEMYFDAIPNNLRGHEVYCALLKSYAHHGCFKKGVATMEKIRELGFLRNTSVYNAMLSFYYEMREVGYADDMDLLAEEMREKGINKDEITYNILLKVYAENLLIEKMEKLLAEWEADPLVNLYCGYLRNTLTMLKQSEESREGSLNKIYLSMILYLGGMNDMDGAERFWEEWFSKKKEMDFEIPKAMISAYSMKGQWEKAERIVLRLRESGIERDANSIYCLASAYVNCKQMHKAVEASMKAISVSEPGWIPGELYTIESCFQYLECQGNDAAKEELYKMLREHCGLPTWACDHLKNGIPLCNGYYKSPISNFECGEDDDEGEDEQ